MKQDKINMKDNGTSIQEYLEQLTQQAAEPGMKIFLVGLSPVVQAGLSVILTASGKYEVTAFSSCRTALENMSSEVVLLITEPGLMLVDDESFIARLKQDFPEVLVLVYSWLRDINNIKDEIQNGAKGYVIDHHFTDFDSAIGHMQKGEIFLCSFAGKIVMNHVINRVKDFAPEVALTDREATLVRMWVGEKSNVQIAKELSISVRTVETHRKNIMEKLGVKNFAGLVKYAFRTGIANL